MYWKCERKLGLQEAFKNLSRHLKPDGKLERASANSPDSPIETDESWYLACLENSADKDFYIGGKSSPAAE